MSRCWICDQLITDENRSVEHIILNSLGGRLKSSNLLCKKCNSNFGRLSDNALTKQLNFLAVLLDIKRERGAPQPIVGEAQSGEQYLLGAGGKPECKTPSYTQGSREVTYTARSEKEANVWAKKFMKKHPEYRKEKMANTSEYLSEPLSISIEFGGRDIRRAFCKMAINFYILKGGQKVYIDHLIPYIKGDLDLDVVGFYYSDKVLRREPKQVLHVIALRTIGKVVYAYIELFSTEKCVVLLSDAYSGEELTADYVFDVLTGEEVSMDINPDISPEQIKTIITEKTMPTADYKKSLSVVLDIAAERNTKSAITDALYRGYKNSLGKYPKGVLITPEMVQETYDAMQRELEKFFENLYQRPTSKD